MNAKGNRYQYVSCVRITLDDGGSFPLEQKKTGKPLAIEIYGSPTTQIQDEYFYFLYIDRAAEDYRSMRVLWYTTETLNHAALFHHGSECLEKTMKGFLVYKREISNKKAKIKLHKLNELRVLCAKYDDIFDGPQFSEFCDLYSNHKVNEILRYGIEGEAGYIACPELLIKMVDKIFIKTLVLIGKNAVLSLGLIFCQGRSGYSGSNLPTKKVDFLRECLKHENDYFDDLINLFEDHYERES